MNRQELQFHARPPQQQGKYHCKFRGCNKAFRRREHLSRHSRTHSESRYVCQVCLKDFTRRLETTQIPPCGLLAHSRCSSDSLQRHLGLHGDTFKPGPSGRSKRACVTCHASKIKCDGTEPCSGCLKKGVDCMYDHLELDAQKEGSVGVSASVESYDLDISHGLEASSLNNTTAAAATDTGETPPSFTSRLAAALNKNKGPIDWSAARIESDLPPSAAAENPGRELQSESNEGDANLISLPKSITDKYRELYFTNFHHRWPIIHAPTFEEGVTPPVLVSSLSMIGAWLTGTHDSQELAMNIHNCLMDYTYPRLCQLSSSDLFNKRSTVVTCQSALLNIIFGLYCGKEIIISRVVIMRNVLVAALREIGLFKPEIPDPYDKPGYFVPNNLVREEERQRLAACLFKIDSYLNILRGQPELLTPEELHFSLPCTFALWNSNGLYEFEGRYLVEPLSRRQTTICQTIRDTTLDWAAPTDRVQLVEDIQLGICAMHSKIWQLLERARDGQENGVRNAIERDTLRRQLESWRRRLVQIPIQQTDDRTFSQEQHQLMRYYYGFEDHSQSGWQCIVLARPKNLIFDSLILCHLFGIHLHADIRALTQLAKDKNQSNLHGSYGVKYQKAQQRRESTTYLWAESAVVRRALCHAADILVSYNNMSDVETKTVDPVIYVALSVAALVVWAYCTFGGNGCAGCADAQMILPLLGASVELTIWSDPRNGQIFEADKETWIEMGGCRGAVAGIQLCRCNIDLLVSKFQTCIPNGWNVADKIAPGIFNVRS